MAIGVILSAISKHHEWLEQFFLVTSGYANTEVDHADINIASKSVHFNLHHTKIVRKLGGIAQQVD